MATIRASHLLTQALQLRGDANGFHLDIQLNADPEAKQSEILHKMTEATGLKLAGPLTPASQIAHRRDTGGSTGLQPGEPDPATGLGFSPGLLKDVWIARETLFRDGATVMKLSVLSSGLCVYLDHMQWASEVEVVCVAQSSGLIFAALAGPPVAVQNYIQSIKTDLTVLNTSTNVERWKADPDTLPLMQAVKHQFDPNRTLNPGRFLGGI
jgi:hypothetical protein